MKAMKSIMRFFSIAALAAAMATMVGCAKEELNNTNGLTFTTTVQLPDGGGKAIGENGEKTFAVGDRIKLTVWETPWPVYISEPLTALNISSDGKAAEFTFNFASAPTFPLGSSVETTYPANYQGIDLQELGTLQSLPAYDYTTGFSTITTEGQLPTYTKLENQYAILKLKILNSASQDITSFINDLYININDQDIEVTRGAGNYGTYPFYTHFADDTLIYVVVPPIANGNIVFTARIDGTGYTCIRTKTVENKTLEKGHMYPVELTMGEATVTWNTAIINGTAGSGNGINTQILPGSSAYQGASLGGIQLNTTSFADWVNGVISDGGRDGSIFFKSGYGNIKQIVMTGFTKNSGELISGWEQSGTTFTWTQDPLLEPSNRVYLVDRNSLSLTAGDGARIVFTVE